MMKRGAWWLVPLAAALQFACANEGRVGDRGRGGPRGAEEKLYSVANPCGGLDATDAGELLGVPATEIDQAVLGEMFENACSLKPSGGRAGKAIMFTLHREGSVADARAASERLAASLSTTVTGQPVAGLGDDAVWYGSKAPVVLERLLVRKGNVWFDIVAAPEGLPGSRRLAERILRKLS